MARSLGKFTLSAGMVQINVGANETPFDIHLELLCDRSTYFDSLFANRSQKPISSDPLCFPDEDPDIFAGLLGWMYYGHKSIDLPPRDSVSFLFKLWVLAGKFEILNLQRDVMQLCQTEMDKEPRRLLGSGKVDYVYAHTLPKSPLRFLLVDNWMRNASQECFLKRRERLPRQFLEDFCSALIEDKRPTVNAEETDHITIYY